MSAMRNIYLFYAMPRSGSTPISKILGYYLEQNYGYTYLEEYFNRDFIGARMRNHKIEVDLRLWRDRSVGSKITIPQLIAQSKQRLQRLSLSASKHDHKYSLKMFPYFELQIFPEYRNLTNISHVIFIARENVFEHLLSYLLSFSTMKFYTPDGLSFENESVEAKEDDFRKFNLDVEIFSHRIKKHHSPRIVYYEDFLKHGPEGVVRAAGFKRNLDWGLLPMPPRQNVSDKLSLFSNPDEVISWYRKSPLNALYPINQLGRHQ
jgi:hypothetical protein